MEGQKRLAGPRAAPASANVLAPTLSEVQQAYVAEYSLKEPRPPNTKRKETLKVVEEGDQSKPAVVTALGNVTAPIRQTSYYGKQLLS